MDDKTIGQNIRRCREARGFKRETLAEMVELSSTYMGAIERGIKLPKLETFIRIANALETPSDILLGGVLTVENQITASKLSEDLDKLPPQEQKRIFNVVRVMIEDAQQK